MEKIEIDYTCKNKDKGRKAYFCVLNINGLIDLRKKYENPDEIKWSKRPEARKRLDHICKTLDQLIDIKRPRLFIDDLEEIAKKVNVGVEKVKDYLRQIDYDLKNRKGLKI